MLTKRKPFPPRRRARLQSHSRSPLSARARVPMDPAAATADGLAFLEFVDYAISVISSSGGDGYESPGDGAAPSRPPWGWAVAQVLKSCCAYSSGVTSAILLSDLFQVRYIRFAAAGPDHSVTYIRSSLLTRWQMLYVINC
jgi:hypothetical protein